jgi:hypothetical protein
MKTLILVCGLGVLAVATASAQYQYYYTDPLTSINTNDWTTAGAPTASSSGLTASTAGTLLSTPTITPTTTTSYEIKMQLNFSQAGGYYSAIFRASSNATFADSPTGTYYGIEVRQLVFTNGACSSATLMAYKTISGSVTVLAQSVLLISKILFAREDSCGERTELSECSLSRS